MEAIPSVAVPSVDTVLQALDALFRQPDEEGKHKASLWLTELQSGVCCIFDYRRLTIVEGHLNEPRHGVQDTRRQGVAFAEATRAD